MEKCTATGWTAPSAGTRGRLEAVNFFPLVPFVMPSYERLAGESSVDVKAMHISSVVCSPQETAFGGIVRIAPVVFRVVVGRLERQLCSVWNRHRLAETVHPLPVEIPVVDIDQALLRAARQRRRNVHLPSQEMHVRSDEVEVNRPACRGRRRDFVVRIVWRNRERLIDERQDVDDLLFGFFFAK